MRRTRHPKRSTGRVRMAKARKTTHRPMHAEVWRERGALTMEAREDGLPTRDLTHT